MEMGGLVFMTEIRVLQSSIGFMVLHLCLQLQLLVIIHSCAQNLEPMLRHTWCMCVCKCLFCTLAVTGATTSSSSSKAPAAAPPLVVKQLSRQLPNQLVLSTNLLHFQELLALLPSPCQLITMPAKPSPSHPHATKPSPCNQLSHLLSTKPSPCQLRLLRVPHHPGRSHQKLMRVWSPFFPQ